MDKVKLQELASDFAKGLKTQHDLNDLQKCSPSWLLRLPSRRIDLALGLREASK